MKEQTLDAIVLGELEIEWWTSYHTRDFSKLDKDIRALRKAQFSVEISDEAAKAYVNAADLYISYKKALAQKSDDLAIDFLKQAREQMTIHYQDIAEKLKK